MPKLLKPDDDGKGLATDGIKGDLFVAHLMVAISAMGGITLKDIHDRVERANERANKNS